MATYLVLNAVFLAVTLAVLRWRNLLRWNRAVTATLAVLLVTTAVFDSLIVQSGIVAYDTARTLSITIGAAPIEDFFYAALAAILIPSVWHALQKGSNDA